MCNSKLSNPPSGIQPSQAKDIYRKAGNVFHTINLLNVLVYAAMVVNSANPRLRHWFDESWLSNGFCVADTALGTSHDLCLYVDVIMAATLGLVHFKLKSRFSKSPEMQQANEIMKWQALSVLGHGLAHGFIAAQLRSQPIHATISALEQQMTISSLVKMSLLGQIFWFPMLRSAIPKQGATNAQVVILAFAVIFCGLQIETRFGFTYVQTVITAVFTYTELFKSRESKDNFTFMVFGFIVVPIGMLPWWEAMACTSGTLPYASLGGHVLYDASIPFGLLVAYVTIYMNAKQIETAKIKVV